MFCKNCGKQLGPEIKFCPACGTKMATQTDAPYEQRSTYSQSPADRGSDFLPGDQKSEWGNSNPLLRRLLRPRSPRMLGGVCAAFALHYGWNLDLVRIFTAIFGLFYGLGILAYLACWIIIPEAQYALPTQSR